MGNLKLITRKRQRNPNLNQFIQWNNWPVLIINASGMKDKGRLRNSSRLNENRDMTTKHAVILDNTLNKKKIYKEYYWGN